MKMEEGLRQLRFETFEEWASVVEKVRVMNIKDKVWRLCQTLSGYLMRINIEHTFVYSNLPAPIRFVITKSTMQPNDLPQADRHPLASTRRVDFIKSKSARKRESANSKMRACLGQIGAKDKMHQVCIITVIHP